MKLHHTVFTEPNEWMVESIRQVGLVPQVADAYKDLVSEEIRHLPVVWLAEGIWQGLDYPVFEVDSGNLDKNKLHPCGGNLGWWVYQGHIPPQAIKPCLMENIICDN